MDISSAATLSSSDESSKSLPSFPSERHSRCDNKHKSVPNLSGGYFEKIIKFIKVSEFSKKIVNLIRFNITE
jgi:hypothetical protein